MSKWYEYNSESKKALLILMERTKKTMSVSAGKVLDLSLETFTMVKCNKKICYVIIHTYFDFRY
jgi:hypothetical protein